MTHTTGESPIQSRGARFAEAKQRLAGAQKGSAAVPAYLRYVNRRLGGQLACVAYALERTPTEVSLLSAGCSAIGLVLLATLPANVIVGLVVALTLALGYALDSADGQLARVRGGGTRAGEWLDHVLDIGKVGLLHSCVLISFYRHFHFSSSAYLLIPLVFLTAQAVNFFGNMLRDALRQNAGMSRQPPSTHNSLRSSLVLLPFDHGTLCWVFVLLGWHSVFVGAYLVLAVVNTAFAIRALWRSYHNLLTLDQVDAA